MDDVNGKHKHKHKHKCNGDELCKHRKHKKRRKHKKHHHRELATVAADDGSSPMLTPEKPNDEDEQCDGDGDNSIDSGDSNDCPKVADKPLENKKLQAAKNALTKSVNIKLDKLEWPLDEDLISSVTEDSSGSSYVSISLH